jgi:hypothetical protein
MPIGLERMNDVLTPKVVEAGGVQRELTIGMLRGDARLPEALGLHLLSGRALAPGDAVSRGGAAPALVTGSLARTLFPGDEPVGQVVSLAGRLGSYQVVGIVPDFAFGSITQPVTGVVVSVLDGYGIDPSLVVRAERPGAIVEPVRRLIGDLAPDAHRVTIATGREILARDLGPQRLGAWFFSGFGLIALVLGAGGVFGLVAYLAEARRREFGVRVALGATPRDLMRRGVAAGLVPVGIGAVPGFVVAAIISRLFVTALPGLSTLDPLTYAGVALLMAACAGAAGLSAAWRLRRMSPSDALRAE